LSTGQDPADRWIIIPNWDKFQHGHQRNHPWIRLYLELNSKDEWLSLSTAARGMLTTIWVEYARSGGHLRGVKAMQLCGKSARSAHLRSLVDAGFIRLSASKPSRARSRRVEEVETPKSPLTENGLVTCAHCGVAFKTNRRLAEHLENVHWEYTE